MIHANSQDTVKKGQQHYNELERLRAEMVQAANKLGLTHPTVLAYSQEIDRLHNAFLKLTADKAFIYRDDI